VESIVSGVKVSGAAPVASADRPVGKMRNFHIDFTRVLGYRRTTEYVTREETKLQAMQFWADKKSYRPFVPEVKHWHTLQRSQ